MHDAVVIGSGPNGLSAAAHLARRGWSVLVLETAPTLGGACRHESTSMPGFVRDVGAAFFPFGPVSKAFTTLDLEGASLRWTWAPYDSCHPAPDGSVAAISRDLGRSVESFGRDGEAWRAIAAWHRKSRDVMLPALLETLPPSLGALLDLGFDNAMTLASVALASGRRFGETHFSTPAAQRVIPGLALHTDVGPDDPFGAVVGFMLAIMASSAGFPVPEGGSGAITAALARRLSEDGGEVRLATRASRVIVREGRAAAVVTDRGDEIAVKRAVLGDVGAPALYLDLLRGNEVPARVVRAMKSFHYGFGTFKVDWALSGPVPWTAPEALRSAVVHAGDSVDDLARFTAEVRAGRIPDNPYLVIGQQSLADPSRAPERCHTLYAYSRVPARVPGGWAAAREAFADRLEERIEGLAPGFRARVVARVLSSPDDLASQNENLVGGDLGGGTGAITKQLIFKPVFPYFRYRTPVKGLYLCSSYAHPGPGVHGMCGYNAAMVAAKDCE